MAPKPLPHDDSPYPVWDDEPEKPAARTYTVRRTDGTSESIQALEYKPRGKEFVFTLPDGTSRSVATADVLDIT